MRTSILGGALLVVAAPLLMGVSSVLDLELEPVVLAGTALGAVVALVGDRTPGVRLVGFLAGVALAWVGFLVRAGYLPDTDAGRAVAVAVVLALAVGLAAATRDRLPLWAVLLGAGGFAASFESTFSAAPTEVVSSSTSAVTAWLVCTAVGFLVCGALAPARRDAAPTHRDDVATDTTDDLDLVKGERA